MRIPLVSGIKTGLGVAAVAGTIITAAVYPRSNTNTPQENVDKFEYVTKPQSADISYPINMKRWLIRSFSDTIALPPPTGSCTDEVLAFAPAPQVVVKNEIKNATFVVDVTNNILYHYDAMGNPIMAYRVASGKQTPSMMTDEGVRRVSHVERYPYSGAPAHTRRHREPHLFGPRCIILDKLDPETGKISSTGEFIHGNNNAKSIGKHASGGCMRMDNTVIKDLAKAVKRDDIVVIIRRGFNSIF